MSDISENVTCDNCEKIIEEGPLMAAILQNPLDVTTQDIMLQLDCPFCGVEVKPVFTYTGNSAE